MKYLHSDIDEAMKDYIRIVPVIADCPNCGSESESFETINGDIIMALEIQNENYIRRCGCCGFEIEVNAQVLKKRKEISEYVSQKVVEFKQRG